VHVQHIAAFGVALCKMMQRHCDTITSLTRSLKNNNMYKRFELTMHWDLDKHHWA